MAFVFSKAGNKLFCGVVRRVSYLLGTKSVNPWSEISFLSLYALRKTIRNSIIKDHGDSNQYSDEVLNCKE